jgi:hypothetical protein
MAKKIISQEFFTVNKAEREIVFDGNIAFNQFLLVTNLTKNKPAYQFNSPTYGAVAATFDEITEKTTLLLKYDIENDEDFEDGDEYQAIVEVQETEFTPAESLLDAVGKLRVSNPANLIDTDFEYGLQATKWETLQTVNNIPTVYSTSGDTPVEGIITVEAVIGSKQVKVICNTPHNLSIGNPVSVQGLTDYQAEGYFSISGVPDSLTFFFELDVPAVTAGDISGSYTTIVAAKFFEGSPLNLLEENGALTDGADQSTVTVTTKETHGFSPRTKVYLRNSVGPKRLQIANPVGNAPDGRPYIDNTPFFNTTSNINAVGDSGRPGYRTKNLVAYDWEPTHVKYLAASDIDVTTDQITWTGHGMYDTYCLLFNTPFQGQTNMGIEDGSVFFVKKIDDNIIELYEDEGLSNKVDIGAHIDTYGLPRLGLVYKIDSVAGNTRYTPYYTATQVSGNYNTGYLGQVNSGQTRSFFINLTSIVGPAVALNSYVNFYQTYYSGDRNSGHEFYIVYWPDGSNQRHAGRGRNSGTENISKNMTGNLTTSGANVGVSIQIFSRSGGSGNQGFRVTVQSQSNTNDTDHSGFDLTQNTYGLGGSNPERVIGFQGRLPSYNSYTNNDQFSNLGNQRQRGRYGTITPQYSNTVTAGNGNGSFNIDYNNSGTNTVSGNQIFYVFANLLSIDKNTIYLADHGITDGQTGVINVTTSNYNAGERFAFSDNNGTTTTIDAQTAPVTFSVISADLFRVALDEAPGTDDIQRFPQNFEVTYRRINELYNTVYIANHKVTGTAEAEYQVEGLNEASPTVYAVTAEGSSNYIFNSTKLPSDSADPKLVVYRGLDYQFSMDALGHPFYLTTDDGTGYVSGTYVGEYTTNVTGSRTDSGVITWTVDATAPDTLYYVCGNHGEMSGEIEVRDQGTAIGGLSNDVIYNLTRVNDSRLTVAQTVSTDAEGTTGAVGRSNNNTITEFIDIQTALGVTPTAATITGVEYRGDFGGNNEYVLMSFTDGESFFIGQRNGTDSSVFSKDEFFPTKDVTNLLVDNGGNLGVNVTFDPTSQINFSPSGMSNWWEIRFTVIGDSGSVVLGSGGLGLQEFVVESLTGAYDGVFEIVETPSTNSFVLQTDFTIPSRKYELTTTEVSAANDTITFADKHNLIPGELVTYDPGANEQFMSLEAYTAREGLFNVIVVDDTTIKLSDSALSAASGVAVDIADPTGTHQIISSNIIKNSQGDGLVSIVQGQNAITGNGTNFLATFKRFDKIYIQEATQVREYTVDTITTNENMTIAETAGFFSTISDTEFFYPTQIMLRPDGFSLHKSFDGGVDITAGTSPDSKIIRQSRKYFRYQSGKGIQNSFAINFNPPKIVQQLIKASDETATVTTQEAHNLRVGDEVKIEGANVSYGENTYNGIFAVVSVPDDFTFTYTMESIPDQLKAEGFPTYVRTSWADSYIRAGMFDDQNGFFYEYDGTYLYAVRRSSTLQLAGTVNSTRGSQIITGNNTSFTTQIFNGDKIVIRGQSYKVVEVSSDLKLVVQPAYRGVSAKNVKITKTVDTRVPQHDFNIDKCNGKGPSGFVLNLTKIQMAYADYSWYGAGKIRFGFKDQKGHVVYVHEFKHNNRLNESYFRSGNLPGRYEIENGPNASTAPTLFHFGTSIIMDGTFDDDKAYLLTANSRPFAFTNGSNFTMSSTAISTFDLVTLNGKRVFVYAIPVSETDAQAVKVGTLVRDPSNTALPEGTYITQVKVDGADSKIFTSHPATATEPGGATFPDITNATTITLGETTAIELTQPIPLISIRLAPSVDSSLTGKLGEREIINRMQMALRQAGVTSNEDVEIFLILNALPSRLTFNDADKPSLSEIIEHVAGDTLQNGTTIYSLKSSAGSVEIDLGEILELGNSILGGDGIFPAGPDLLTLAVQPQSTTGIGASTPFFVTGKITWTESQA